MDADFIAGFVKAGVDKGLSDKTIERIVKVANPMGMFNQVGVNPQEQYMALIKHMLAQHQPIAGQSQIAPNTNPIQ